MKTVMLLAALIGLTACSAAETLAKPTGPAFALNTGRWQPSTADLQLPSEGKAE
jgi:type IV secretion system protein VirB7